MKKDLIFAPVLTLIAAALFLLRVTGMGVHIAVSVLGVIALVAYAVLTKKEWKIPALEIGMRVCYGVALITGIVIMNVHGVAALAIIHKLTAVLFFAGLIALIATKVVDSKKG